MNKLTEIVLQAERKLTRLRKMWADVTSSSGQTYVQDRISQYREMWQAVADSVGAEFTVMSDAVWKVELNNRSTMILNDVLQFDDPVTLEVAGMKPLAFKILAEAGLQVPPHEVFRLDEIDKAYAFSSRFPEGVVVKPASGTSSGQGVTTHILSKKEVRKAAVLASLYGSDLMIEPMIPGECYRILVLDGKAIHAVCRRGPRLIGDGQRNVSGLISQENMGRKKDSLPVLDTDRDCLFTLEYQHLSLDSVPAKDQIFLVKSVNDPVRKQIEVRTVYNETVTDSICDSLKETAEQAAKLLGSRFVGVDFITTDASVSLRESGGVINELNTTPGLHHHYDSRSEKYPGPAVEALKSLLKLSD